MKRIPIFFSFNDDYVMPAAVAFWSLLHRAHDDVFYEMHVLHSDITDKNQLLLQGIVERFDNATLHFENANGFLEKEFAKDQFCKSDGGSVFTSNTLLKCFAARFFPQYDKIIYSDVDVVFTGDISEIYDVDLKDKYIAAVKGAFMKFLPGELAHFDPATYEKFKDTYFAGGIWVMNLAQIRADGIEDKMLAIIQDDAIIKRWPDQDIMNLACDNRVEYLPLNYIGYPYLRDTMHKENWDSHYSRDELYDSIINPKIIHYAGHKPWNGDPKYSEMWWAIFDYLGLQRNHIFKTPTNPAQKIRKYKRLFNTFVVISAVLLVALVLALLS